MRKISIYLGILLMFASCDEDFFSTTIELDPPAHQPKIVSNCIVSLNGTTTKVLVTSTQPYLGVQKEVQPLQDCNVTVQHGEKIYGFTKQEATELVKYNYELEDPIRDLAEMDTLYYSVNSVSLGQATAKAVVPVAIKALEGEYIRNAGINLEGEKLSGAKLRFQDLPGKNFYRIAVLRRTGNSIQSQLTKEDNPTFEASVMNFQQLLIADDLFDEKLHEIELKWSFDVSSPENIYVLWVSISEDQYQYDRRLKKNDGVGENPFISPVPLNSNIDGGIGVFAIENSKIFTIK